MDYTAIEQIYPASYTVGKELVSVKFLSIHP